MLSGMPSDERSELVHSMWENAVLRAEVHACQQALEVWEAPQRLCQPPAQLRSPEQRPYHRLPPLDVVARAWIRSSRTLNLASSPDRTRVVVTGPDETMQLYKLYDAPSSAKKGAFTNLRRDVRRWDHVLGGGAGAVLR